MNADSSQLSGGTAFGITPRALVITAVMSGVVLVLGLSPVLAPPPGLDRIAHATAFAGLVMPSAVLRPVLLWVMIPALGAFGGLLEITQPLFGRAASGTDMFANIAGLLLGTILGIGTRRALAARRVSREGVR
jgi:hypothetical protein